MALWHVIVLLCKQHGQIRSSRGVLHRIADRLQYFFNLIQCCFFFFFCFNNNLQFQIIPKIGNSINARCDILPVKILSQLFYRRYRSKTDVFEYLSSPSSRLNFGVFTIYSGSASDIEESASSRSSGIFSF